MTQTISRRGFFTGLISALAAPAIIRTPGLLMPVRAIAAPAQTNDMALAVFASHWEEFNLALFEQWQAPSGVYAVKYLPVEVAA